MSNATFLGKVGMTLKGEWNNSTTYERLDVVSYEGSSYIALTQSRNSRPSEDNQDWMIGAKHGEFTEEQLEEFKQAVIAESLQEIDSFTQEQKQELEDYEDAKETELNNYTADKKSDIDSHTTQKINAYNENAYQKETAYNNNATSKTNNFNSNATEKTTAYNENAASKTEAFDGNASNKTTSYNENAASKIESFDSNATAKTTIFNNNASDKKDAFDINATSKTNTFNTNATNKTGDFNSNSDDKTSAFNQNATEKTNAFNQNYTEKLEAFNQAAASIEADITNIKEVLGIDVETYSSEQTYSVGDLVVHSNKIYECNTQITVAEAWDSTKWTEVDVLELIKNIDNELQAKQTEITELQQDNTNLLNALPEVTGSGSNITLEGTSKNKYKKAPLPGGNSTQASYTGKNLLDKTQIVSKRVDTTVTQIDNGVKITGAWFAQILLDVEENTTYYLSYIIKNIVGSTKLVGIFAGNGTSSQIAQKGEIGGSFNSGNNNQITIAFYTSNGGSGETEFTNIQLEEGSTATSYEPYCRTEYQALIQPINRIFTMLVEMLK